MQTTQGIQVSSKRKERAQTLNGHGGRRVAHGQTPQIVSCINPQGDRCKSKLQGKVNPHLLKELLSEKNQDHMHGKV